MKRAAGLALLVLLTGCVGPHGGVGDGLVERDVDACAAVLPLALQSVGGQGRLVAIRPLKKGEGATILREAGVQTSPPRTPDAGQTSKETKGCAIAYRGTYDATSLQGAFGSTGRYAVVFVRVRHPEVRAILVTDTLPKDVTR